MATSGRSISLVVLAIAAPAVVVLGKRSHPLDVGASQVELGADMASAKPHFHPVLFNSMLRPLISMPVQPCGTPLFGEVRLNETMRKAILNSTGDFFSEESADGKAQLVAVGKSWETLDPSHRGKLPIMEGHALAWKPDASTLDALRKALAAEEPLEELAFDVGVDLRECWGDIHDVSDRPVCGSDVLDRLVGDLAQVEPSVDTTGQSGSTIITNVEGFIVKNTKDAAEYRLLRQVMPAFGNAIRNRPEQTCYATALAPICVAFQLPGLQRGVQWIAMRKIEISGGQKAHVLLDGDEVKDIDVKGPKFANSLRDGKSYFGAAKVWKKKDTGFAKMFPHGLQLRGCGSRDAALTLELDAELLLSAKMTDYSLFGMFYAMPAEDQYECVCKDSDHPTFPMIFDVKYDAGAGEAQTLRMAVGVIDYIEKAVGALDQWSGLEPLSMSTMKVPGTFKEWWMRMWPSYFHLPPRKLQVAPDSMSGVVEASDNAPAESLDVGQTVRALTKVKWEGPRGLFGAFGAKKHRQSRAINGTKFKAYFKQIPEDSPEKISAGSKYKVIAGDEGVIASLEDQKVLVHWDKYKEVAKLHSVRPSQIMGWPPSIVTSA